MVPAEIKANPAFAAAARNLMLDAAAVECISALRAEGIRAILLKVPVTARWLYSDGGIRDYTDVDRLVADDLDRLLQRLGFEHAVLLELEVDAAEQAKRGVILDDQHDGTPHTCI